MRKANIIIYILIILINVMKKLITSLIIAGAC